MQGFENSDLEHLKIVSDFDIRISDLKDGIVWPQTEQELMKLPGIGKYTARAVLCFAFDEQVAVVDTNVRKVILTQFQISNVQCPIINEKEVQTIAEQLLPVGKAYEWNQALMDYAAVMLKKEKIPVQMQPTFIGSHRYYRGLILKVLLQKGTISFDQLGDLIKKDYRSADESWLGTLVREMEKDGFVVVKHGMVGLQK